MASLKKALSRDGDWVRVKEILGWVINTHRGTFTLFYKHQLDLLSLLVIPTTQRRISVKNLERLIGKIHSMHLNVSGSISHFYVMQVVLTLI